MLYSAVGYKFVLGSFTCTLIGNSKCYTDTRAFAVAPRCMLREERTKQGSHICLSKTKDQSTYLPKLDLHDHAMKSKTEPEYLPNLESLLRFCYSKLMHTIIKL